MKKKLALLMSTMLLAASIMGCGGDSGSSAQNSTEGGNAGETESEAEIPKAEEETVVGETEDAFKVEEAVETGGYQKNENLNADEKVTLNVFGPGVFNVGEEGVTDLNSGIFRPGYKEIIKRWNEFYPNVTLEIEAASWDSWQSAITTACLSGEVDIIMHGATMTDLTYDLSSYLEQDPEYYDRIYATASRRTTENPDVFKVSGISVSLSPCVAWLDTKIFEDYGVELPDEGWTYDDVLSLAEQMTGTDPVTGEQTYGLQMYSMGGSNLWFNYVQAANALGAKVFKYGATISDCEVDFMVPESIAAFQLIADQSKFVSPGNKEGVAVTTALNGENDWAILFADGVVARYFEMQAAELDGRYVALNMPLCSEGEYKGIPTPHAGDNNMAIYKDSDNKEWAWEFIKFMTTDEKATQWVVSNMEVPNNKAGKDMVQELVGENLATAIDNTLNTLPEYYNNATNDVFNNVSFGSVTNTLITAVDNVINETMTPEEAAQSMQDYVDEYISTLN